MADERDEEREDGPKIRVVDRRMLNEDERKGKLSSAPAQTAPVAPPAPPSPEPVAAPPQAEAKPVAPGAGEFIPAGAGDDADEEAPSPEELAEMRQQIEGEQFAAIEAQMGRALTEDEKVSVRAEMEKEARSMAALEVTPVLARILAELSARAAVHMGLMPNPYSRLIAKNDVEARLAIDAFGAIFEVIKERLDPTSQREYARVLNDLRMNFVTQTGSVLGAGGAGGAAVGSGPRIIH